jgi:hypothetical protein
MVLVVTRASITAVCLVATLCGALAQSSTQTPAPAGASVYFESPTDGSTVPLTFTVRAGLRGMGVAPAGETAPNSGHHHLLIDQPTVKVDEPLPVGNRVVHFSNGETEIEVSLSPGRHKLQLVLGDAGHVNFNPPVASKVITVFVRRN